MGRGGGKGFIPREEGEEKGLYLGNREMKRVYTWGRGGGKGFIPGEEGEEKGLYLGKRGREKVHIWGIGEGKGFIPGEEGDEKGLYLGNKGRKRVNLRNCQYCKVVFIHKRLTSEMSPNLMLRKGILYLVCYTLPTIRL